MLDSHVHLWRIGQHGCIWPTCELPAIHCDFELADAKRQALPAGVTGAILVQSQPCDADTEFLLDQAEGDDFVAAVIGWTDLLAPDAPERIATLAGRGKLRGLRPMLQGLPDGWIADPALDPAIRAMVAGGLRFDALVFTRHLGDLRRFAERHPELPIIVDHGAKPPIAAGAISEWRAAMAGLAALPNLHCKLSGLLTEAGEKRSAEDLRPYVESLMSLFGPDRLIWGSDWPVLNLAGDYAAWLSLARSLVEECDAAALSKVFERNGRRFYGCSARE